jgi:hypothetical protein
VFSVRSPFPALHPALPRYRRPVASPAAASGCSCCLICLLAHTHTHTPADESRENKSNRQPHELTDAHSYTPFFLTTSAPLARALDSSAATLSASVEPPQPMVAPALVHSHNRCRVLGVPSAPLFLLHSFQHSKPAQNQHNNALAVCAERLAIPGTRFKTSQTELVCAGWIHASGRDPTRQLVYTKPKCKQQYTLRTAAL